MGGHKTTKERDTDPMSNHFPSVHQRGITEHLLLGVRDTTVVSRAL